MPVVLAGQRVLTSTFVPPAHTRCRAYSSAGVTASANNTLVLVPLGAESYDIPTTMHSVSSNTSRITVPVAGCYHIVAQVTWAANVTGRRLVTVRKNAAGSSGGGTQVMNNSVGAATSTTQFQVADELELAANDYLEIFAFQASGGTLDIVAGETNTFMIVRLVDPT